MLETLTRGQTLKETPNLADIGIVFFFKTKVNCSRNKNQENIQNPILIEAAIFKN